MGAGKDIVSAVKRRVTPGQHLTQAPGPRVLIHRFGETFGPVNGRQGVVRSAAEELAGRLRLSGVPTVRVAGRVGDDINLNEWDCLVTPHAPGRFQIGHSDNGSSYDEPHAVYAWEQSYPKHLSIIYIASVGNTEMVDFYPPSAEEDRALPSVVVFALNEVVGGHIRKADGLADSLAALVMRNFVPVVKQRTTHTSFKWSVQPTADERAKSMLTLTPFLYGPDDVVLAGSYPRNDAASVWLLPYDIPDLHPWVVEALREWHDLYPDRFPVLPDWQDNTDWRTAAEAAIADAKDEHFEQFKAKYDEFLVEQKVFEDQAADAKQSADTYHRALLSEDGPSLERAVELAITDLGFRVVNMDLVHPEGDRREDFRVYDDTESDWVAIVEVKGGKGGPKENELHAMGKWATRFAADEGRVPSAQWFVVNHLRFTDPSARPVPFGHKPAVAKTFSEVDGSVIDTRALFDLLRLVEADPTLAPQARAFLKGKPPVLTRVHAEDLGTEEPEAEVQ